VELRISPNPQPDARASLQFLGDMPWVSRATAIWPDTRYLARDSDDVNTGYTLRSARVPAQMSALGTKRTSVIAILGKILLRNMKFMNTEKLKLSSCENEFPK